ncbi:hypothetical protein Xmau_00247 [Xenorhabdus mauleonii]|uniref:Insecticide toxin TcdB middle/N-terminal region n=1 Tax=Xenorhabdus mauleonii TaxID=351675 RepID=A0A1I3MXR1_9GAMM|nr:SpvB/TcaC N-terminal domain-containing protein [Xenorhabdus mauleonii]PHM45856.1 hypothetical protein Xmau_00247 [Xenorhabdus mauleonii]SFJ01446.1 Insecticide toxin TcdB middle/N-terminal region [Xenorhabdus mauleonii]
MQGSTPLKIETPSLPSGGGSLKGMGEALNAVGMKGIASFSLPLPVSVGRGLVPVLSLNYSSAAGNGPFGMGWQCGAGFIGPPTARGVPLYAGKDTYLGPDGKALGIVANSQGQPEQRTATSLLGTALTQPHTVTRYQPLVIEKIARLEHWQPQQPSEKETAFWVLFTADGLMHLFGKNRHARIADPQDETRIARWLLEETVTHTGEHIYYHYRAEDDLDCDENEIAQHPGVTAQRYLAKVSYGNIQPETAFFAVKSDIPADNDWLFHLVFDYGERSSSLDDVPEFNASEKWRCRPDSFSRYDYGFEIRTRRLCRQILMFHQLGALAGENVAEKTPALVSRLILDYDLSNQVSLLQTARRLAHEADGTPVLMSPLEMDYQRVSHDANLNWQAMPQLEKLNTLQPYQMVDLYGEGIAGVLYQDAQKAWWYRAPIRDTTAEGTDAVTYEDAKPLPHIPTQQESAKLLDINGDGRLDWVITATGLRGYHTMSPEGEWTPFIPLSAVPMEYFHPQAKLADINGAGLPDLALIGPNSVRVWSNNRAGWGSAQDVAHLSDMPLPVPGRNERHLVAFSDMTGSGQSHLVEVTADSVRYWPNLGHGKFGEPLMMTGFQISGETFSPDRLYMVDLNGSGTTDFIYARNTHLELYVNESGNRFAEPQRIDLPAGVRFDNTCRLQVADTQGLGTASIILTVPHMNVQHWRLDMTTSKPWLLNVINNNMGTETTLSYRSSAQFWLDEKLKAAESGITAVSKLPFPVHLLWHTSVLDEISGNQLASYYDYAHGAWVRQEKEFRGFGRVTQTDINSRSCATQGTDAEPPSLSHIVTWYSTGMQKVDILLPKEYWQGDQQAFPHFTPRFIRYDEKSGDNKTAVPSVLDRYWLHRALKGQCLRRELYGDDNSILFSKPYSVDEFRIQTCLLPSVVSAIPAVLVSVIETRQYRYERVAADPQCSQNIVLKSDEFGFPTDNLEIAYPRRPRPELSPYPASLPETLFASSYDEQQMCLRLTRQRSSYHHLNHDDNTWIAGLMDTSRSDARIYHADKVPDGGFSFEWFSATEAGALLLPDAEADYQGHQRVAYTGSEEKPAIPPLVAYIETAEFDARSLEAFKEVMDEQELAKQLNNAGWTVANVPFSENADFRAWVGQREFTEYASADGFYRPLVQRETKLTGKTTVTWDTHYCVITATEDASGLRMQAHYDYRFMVADNTSDINDNYHTATFDALGRVTSFRFWGTENGEKQGYSSQENETVPFIVPTTVEDALELKPGIPVAGLMVYAPLSWMVQVNFSNQANFSGYDELKSAGIITEDGYFLSLAFRRWQQNNPAAAIPIQANSQNPPHILSVITDRYDADPEQQLRQTVMFSDGFGRALQTAVRHESGEAWVRDENGAIVAGSNGMPKTAVTNFRWAVSGRTEYDGKGQALRTYQPYFLNSWQYVSDDSARQDLYADTHCYDPLGREYQVITAKGGLRQTLFTPWFVVNKDENDTADEMTA